MAFGRSLSVFAAWAHGADALRASSSMESLFADHKYRALMTLDQEEVARQMQPWLRTDYRVAGEGQGYLLFDSDPGGLNNIRMAFEFFIDLAKRSKRTLVLPPQEGVYLIDWGPTTWHNASNKGWLPATGRSTYGDFWDLHDLESKVDIISAQEFYERHRVSLNISEDAEPRKQSNNHIDYNEWKQWLNTHATLARQGPLTADPCREALSFALRDARTSPVLNFPAYLWNASAPRGQKKITGPTSERRYLGCPRKSTSDLHYRSHFYQLASGPVAHMGFRGYVALHLRRNDFQYAQAPEKPDWLVKRLSLASLKGEPVYVASDEIDAHWWANLKEALGKQGHAMYTFKDFVPELKRRGLDEKYSGIVEELICAGARSFLGTQHSTFTLGIEEIREQLRNSNPSWTQTEFGASREYAF